MAGSDSLSSDPDSPGGVWFERHLLKRRLVFWRVIALGVALLLVVSWALWGQKKTGDDSFIARIKIHDVIWSNQEHIALLDKVMDQDRAEALLVHINSPGGSMVGSEDIYTRLRQISRTRPVVVVMDEVATSGGYFVALGGDWIIAHEGTITGSVGVIFQNVEISELLSRIGVDVQSVRSGPLKARPGIFEKMDSDSQEIISTIVDENQNYFLNLVTRHRRLDSHTRGIVSDGRIFSGRQAFDLGLVDEIGGQAEALAKLEQWGIPAALPIRDIDNEEEQELWERFVDHVLGTVVGKTVERVKLDGLMSLWQAGSP